MDNSVQTKLASTINSLGLQLPTDKIDLWLAYKNMKPSSWVIATFDLKKEIIKTKKLYLWLKMAGLKFNIESESKGHFYVSHDQTIADKLSKIAHSEDVQSIENKCKYLGYPPETFIAYIDSTEASVLKSTSTPYPWSPYILYKIRKGHEYHDSLVAKKWYETIKRDLPKVHHEFEKMVSNSHREKQSQK